MQTLTHCVCCQRDVVIFAGNVEKNGSGISRSKDAGNRSAQILVNLDGAVLCHVKLADEKIGTWQKTNTQDGIVGGIGSLVGYHAHRIAGIFKGDDLLAKGKRDTVFAISVFNLIGNFGVKILGQHTRHHVDKGDLLVALGKLLGKLCADVARSNDNCGSGVAHSVVNTLAISPVLALKDTWAVDTGQRRHNGLGAGSYHEVIKVIFMRLSRCEIGPHHMFCPYVGRRYIGLHVNMCACLFKNRGRAVEHLVGITDVISYPQRNAA